MPRSRAVESLSRLGSSFGIVFFNEHGGASGEVKASGIATGWLKGNMERLALPLWRSTYGPGVIFGIIRSIAF